MRIQTLAHDQDLSLLHPDADILAAPNQPDGPFLVGFAASERCIEAALRLRYEVFNLELGEGLEASHAIGLDRDPFDDSMTHLVLLERSTNRLVGTYRLQTMEQARAGRGVYSEQEFDLTQLAPYFSQAVECGRACLARDSRSVPALWQLWFGIIAFMLLHRCRYLFGCCSITTLDPDDGWRALKTIREQDYLHPTLFLPAQSLCSCGDLSRADDPNLGDPLPLPKLFTTYMRLGARVVSQPAIDHAFGTVDFLVMLDGHEIKMSSLDIFNKTPAWEHNNSA